ncbi:MAG: hypothetical protein RL748_3133 [Pseudomonadota bacterium]
MAASCFLFWGKAKPDLDGGAPWHSLPLHCLDVAAVGLIYLRRSPTLQTLFMQTFGFKSQAALESWLVFWLALHDLGKFSSAFQSQNFQLFLQLRPAAKERPYTLRHDSLGMQYWKDVLLDQTISEAWFGPDTENYADGLNYWMRAVTGHHGLPPDESNRGTMHHFDLRHDCKAIDEFIQILRYEIISVDFTALLAEIDPETFYRRSQQLSWWIAGITVLADWLGSNTDFFPYHNQAPEKIQTYWEYALKQAEKALTASEILPNALRQERGLNQLFPHIQTPSPLQAWASTVALSAEPQLHLLEDVTGAGKTEAALVLTQRMLAHDVADGFFIGLPTMATANAMYGRVATMYQQLFAHPTSAVLAHGQRDLVELFAQSVLPPSEAEQDWLQQDETASARCSSWLADHNKRALLAPAGIGTVDQVLLGVLHSKHQSLRLLGMLRKVLVIDEVHACDAYMQRVLEYLLEFHAFIGGSVILLSATLPQAMKQALFAAFARGRGCTGSRTPWLGEAYYPLVSSWRDGKGSTETPIATRPDVQRTLQLRYLSQQNEVIEHIRSALAAGKAVCWMRNTVADAMEAFELFQAELAPENLTLFHARFTLAQRLLTEQKILTLFGKASTPEQRAGQLVIATQVAEQSLDADWDMVITDLAPIDRMLQRAGRLHRHQRPQRGTIHPDQAPPCLLVFGPEWQEQPAPTWFSASFARAAKVYPNHAQLWHSAAQVRQGEITMPQDARRIIEAVFSPEVAPPKGLEKVEQAATGDDMRDVSMADMYAVKLAQGYERGSLDWWSEAKTPSRLGEASSTVMLARWQGDQIQPWVTHEKMRVAVAQSSLRMASRLIEKTAEPQSEKRQLAMAQFLMQLPSQGKWMVVLALEERADGWVGDAVRTDGKTMSWRYSDEIGLVAL